MRLSTIKMPVIIILLLLGITTKVLSQRTIIGRVIDENNKPIPGVAIYPGKSKTGFLTDQEGAFSIQVQDSISELILVIDNTYFLEGAPQRSLGMFDAIREKFTLENQDSIIFRLIKQNTLNTIPKSNRIKYLSDKWYKYDLKYNLYGKLQHVYLRNIENTNEIQYVWDIEYYKDYIQINNYIWQQEKVNRRDKRFFVSTIRFSYDKNGAVREKAVHVNYGNHFNNSHEIFYYQDNRVVNVFCYEEIEHPYYTNVKSWEYKRDPLVEIIQNEIFRRKLYKKIKNKFFKSDYKIIEIR